MDPSNYQTFADNVVNFAVSNGLDGIDFDWEYPGETDIPGIPASSVIDPKDYLAFIQYTRSKLPSSMSMSIAAPASYWYLKGFPLSEIAESLSYIIYMTYDYHGQWDYQNTYADAGCPGGSCLRCHVNLTETMNSLSMITKAGVPSDKVIVGVANYARAFGMSDSSCTSPDCTFTGPSSGAAMGQCTQTAGYLSNAEIPSDSTTWEDSDSDCMIATGGNTWAGYMSPAILASRTSMYQNLNMGGTTLWAIDLQDLNEGNANSTAPVCTDPTICPFEPWQPCTQTYTSIEALVNDTSVPSYCIDHYMSQTLSSVMKAALANYTNLVNNDNYDEKFSLYSNYIQSDLAPDNVADFLTNNWQPYLACPGAIWTDDGAAPYNEDTCGGPCFNFHGSNPEHVEGHWTYTWTNQSGFWADLESQQGVLQSWCSQQNFYWHIPPVNTGVHGIVTGGYTLAVNNNPFTNPTFTVPNPKNIVQGAVANFTAVQALLTTAALSASDVYYVSSNIAGNDTTPLASTIQAAMAPVLMLEQAVASMANIVAIGDEIEAEERRQRILKIVEDVFSVVFLVLPGVGEALEGADLAIVSGLRAILPLVSSLGGTAIDLYNTVMDPSSAWTLIFDFLGDLGSFSDAARAFRGADEAGQVALLGPSIEAKANAILDKYKGCI